MIRFKDAGGDTVRTFLHDPEGALAGTLAVECVYANSEKEPAPLALTPKMARALAADLIAFADSQETENEG